MKITVPNNINANDFPGENDNFYRLLDYFLQFRYETVQAFRNNLTDEDNSYIQVIEYKFNHGEKVIFPNNLKTKPRGIMMVYSEGYAGTPELTFESNGQLGVTVYFRANGSYVYLTKTVDQAIADSTNTAVTWVNQINSRGYFSWSASVNPSRVIITRPGRYLFTYAGSYEGNNAGQRLTWLSKNGLIAGTTSRLGGFSLINNGTDFWGVSGSAVFDLVANDYIELYTWQNSGGPLDFEGNTAENESSLTAHSLEYSPSNVPCVIYIIG